MTDAHTENGRHRADEPGTRADRAGQDTQEPRQDPHEVGAHGWWQALKRTPPRLKELNIGLLASGVAYWGILSIFPALIALVLIYGLVASPEDVTQQVSGA